MSFIASYSRLNILQGGELMTRLIDCINKSLLYTEHAREIPINYRNPRNADRDGVKLNLLPNRMESVNGGIDFITPNTSEVICKLV